MLRTSQHVTFEELHTSDTVIEYIARDDHISQFFFIYIFNLLILIVFLNVTIRIIASCLLFLTLCFVWCQVIEESVTVIHGFGVQLKSKCRNGRESYDFLDRDKIEGTLLQESIRGSSVHFFVSFQVYGESKLIVAFKNIYPGLDALKRVYSSCAAIRRSQLNIKP